MLKIFEVRNRTGWLQQQIILSAWRQVLWSVAHYWKSTGVDKSRVASLRGACQPLVHRWGLGLLEAVDKLARASPLRLWRKEPFFACAEEPNELEIKRKRMDKKALDRYQSKRLSYQIYKSAAKLWAFSEIPWEAARDMMEEAFRETLEGGDD